MKVLSISLLLILLGTTFAGDLFPAGVFPGHVAENDHTLHYRDSLDKWVEIQYSQYCPFSDAKTGGVYVEVPMGTTGLHPLSAILVPYDKFSSNKGDLIAFNKENNIALMVWVRWNKAALCLSSPDADEMLRKHGFQCSAIEVTRLLRVTYR